MGTTLTHNVYLPDEGERNCYSGLAQNWQILDDAVGAIAGKANASHTHGNITNAGAIGGTSGLPIITGTDGVLTTGAFGNTEGTFCEGNDSRLSDARTPLSHTHGSITNDGKLDTASRALVTDANKNIAVSSVTATELGYVSGVTSAIQTQIAGKANASHTHGNISNDGAIGSTSGLPVITGNDGVLTTGTFGSTEGTFCEGNDSRLSDARTPLYHTHGKADITDLFNSANTWTKNQVIASSNDQCYFVKDTVYELGQDYSSGERLGGLTIQDKNGVIVGLLDIMDRSYGHTEMRIRVQQKFDPNSNNRSTTGDILHNEMILGISSTKTNYIGFNADLWGSNHNLGTSTNKWKTLNGINPGALSLPKSDTSVTALSVSGFSFDGSNERVPDTVNLFSNGVALVDGWLCARLKEGAGHYIFINSDDNTNKGGIMSSCFSSGVVSSLGYGINVYVPVKVGDKPAIRWAKPNGGNAQLLFYPCFGNV